MSSRLARRPHRQSGRRFSFRQPPPETRDIGPWRRLPPAAPADALATRARRGSPVLSKHRPLAVAALQLLDKSRRNQAAAVRERHIQMHRIKESTHSRGILQPASHFSFDFFRAPSTVFPPSVRSLEQQRLWRSQHGVPAAGRTVKETARLLPVRRAAELRGMQNEKPVSVSP